MRVAFLIERRNFYRLFGPIVDRALERGWEVACWHDWSHPRHGTKASEFPDSSPAFRHGAPLVRAYRGASGLAAELAASRPPVVIAMRQPALAEQVEGVRWFGLQYTLDLAELIDAQGGSRCDAIGLHSPYWRERGPDCLRTREHVRSRASDAAPKPVEATAVVETLGQKGRIVGIPEMDQHHWIDPAAVRRRLGLDTTTPVVLYCPFPFRTNPRTFWTRHVYGAPGALYRRLAVRLGGKAEYRSHVDHGLDDRSVVRAVRAFCDANDALLVVKARGKDGRLPGYLKRSADLVVDDRKHYYPAMILELLGISALCLHFFSTVAYEAVYAGVPSICIAPRPADLGFPELRAEWFLNLDPGGSFNLRGAVYPVGLDEMVDTFATRKIADFPLDPVARAQYIDKFIGFDDGKSSDRVLDAVQSLVERGSQR